MLELPIRIGLLGGGMMAQIGHLPFFVDDPRCEVVCIAEARPSLAAALAPLIGAGVILPDHRDMLAFPALDAVVISAPRPATGPLTLEILNAGKHVLAEKPMAHTTEQAARLVTAARVKGVHYSVGYMKRFDPGIEIAARVFSELTGSGRLGRLLMARFYDYSKSYAFPIPPHVRPRESRLQRFETWPLWPEWLPVDYRQAYAWFLNAACHDVNLMHLFFPDAAEVIAAHGLDDGSVSALIEADGVPVHLEIAGATAGQWCEGGEFVFEKGRLRFAVPAPMNRDGVTEVRLDDAVCGLPDRRLETGTGWSFARQASGFIDALTGTAPMRNAGEDGLKDIALSEAIWRAAVGLRDD